ncbi:MAG: LLM class flavin-dependent oxidoreductase [Actinobacteria bacterium]|nr:LLM class flavin-dependent oxidoreductase [Actinomycetota bacterium]
MARISSAVKFSASDGLTPLERAAKNKMMLGLFIPLQQGAWTPSKASRGTDWSFEYNAECAVRADELGFDLVFGLAQWLGKGGLGGEIRFRENTQDPLLVTAGLAALTKNIMLISTVHVLYGWHPLLLAKYAATLDHMTEGRWGINMVTGIKKEDFAMFGLEHVEHDLRYEMADEFVDVMKMLWTTDENVNFHGRFYNMEKGFVSPKPIHGRPIIVNATSSGAGQRFAEKHSDIMFITRPASKDVFAAIGERNELIKREARQAGREMKTIINPHVICADTEKEARARRQHFIDTADEVALENFFKLITGGDTVSWKGAVKDDLAVGGNMQVVGTPEQVVEQFLKLSEAGCDGIQVNFFDYLPDLEYFGEKVLPLMKEAGLRN